MNDSNLGSTEPIDREMDMPVEAREVAIAGRACLVILILGVVVLLVLCGGVAVRWTIVS